MNRDQIIESVQEYIKDDYQNYAVLINGPWGSGKTYLYEHYLIDAIDKIERGKTKRKENVYISLYGVSSIDDLAKQVVSQFLIVKKFRNSKMAKRLKKPVSGVLDLVTKSVSFSVGPVSANFGNLISDIEGMIETQNLVLCFDDLERSAIPINEFFGFINNLVEHCSCKVIVLADETNIGKMFANTNVENKYQTILAGRRVVERKQDDKISAGNDANDISIRELKRLNELLFSENYLYRDVKEKVIPKTFFYYPEMSSIIEELVDSKNAGGTALASGDYKKFLKSSIDKIDAGFSETDNRNIRIVISWIRKFKKIYEEVSKYNSEGGIDNYCSEVLSEFLRYSIWVVVSEGKNLRIEQDTCYSNSEYVRLEGHAWTKSYRYGFIERWIKRDAWDAKEFRKAVKMIVERLNRERMLNAPKSNSKGKNLRKLWDWSYMEDEEIRATIRDMIVELKNGDYEFYDYSNIIGFMVWFEKIGIYEGGLKDIQEIMLKLIKNDKTIQSEDILPQTYEDKALQEEYDCIYGPIEAARIARNKQLGKEEIEELSICKSAESFLDSCKEREQYYMQQRSFMEYINLKDAVDMIRRSDNKGIYLIREAFKKVYFMGNVKDFYGADTKRLASLKKQIEDECVIPRKGITHGLALQSLVKELTRILEALDYYEEQDTADESENNK